MPGACAAADGWGTNQDRTDLTSTGEPMGDSDFRVDTEVLRSTGAQLRDIVDALKGAKDDAATLAGHVGHGGLAGKVREFADNWQSRRQEMLETIGGLGEVSEGVGIAFEEWDSELARAISVDAEHAGGER